MSRPFALMLAAFALTLFASATLLFLVELIVGQTVVPLFGGTPAVWNTCMVFYQAVLLAGYAYAHATTAWLGPRRQAALHLGLLCLPLLFFLHGPLAVNKALVPPGDQNPIPGLLLLLCVSVGVPLFVVSTSAPLLQKWFADTNHPDARDPYFLYGASNLGSMIALLGYPTLVQPNLTLPQQRIIWAAGYGLLLLLTAACAVFLWRSPPAAPAPAAGQVEKKFLAGAALPARAAHSRKRDRIRKRLPAPGPTPPQALPPPSVERAVTPARRLRWVLLAAVPSSLMLGATTYITTDIASWPLLWVLPLALYLLSFILVFSRISPRVHQGMVLAMPLLVLLLLFMMLSDLRPEHQAWNLGLHLLALFVVSMVCHGELARDRPATRHLTGFYLLMSLGGVLGGLFNSLVAPVVFTGLAEYPLALMAACLLLPGMPFGRRDEGNYRYDLGLMLLFLAVGLGLIGLRRREGSLDLRIIASGPWLPLAAALLAAVGVTVYVALGEEDAARRRQRWLDLGLPLCLGVLVLGLVWGLQTEKAAGRVGGLARALHVGGYRLKLVLTFGVPAVLCYTFVDRTFRFGLGVGALLLGSAFAELLEPGQVYQTRSFFGVMKVEDDEEGEPPDRIRIRRLVHGTTLHGVQRLSDDPKERNERLSYYHRTGPIGQLFAAYNRDGTRNLGVIGLGTGTLAAYARPGQRLTFYDIDPAVKAIAYDSPKYFTFVDDARKRGARIDLVLGDARLTMERQQLDEADKYGILLVDAFSSDSIPVHLLTRESLRVYLGKLREDGILAFHISNRFLDLQPVLANLAADAGLVGLHQYDTDESYPGKTISHWVVLARKVDYLDRLVYPERWDRETESVRQALLPLSGWPDGGAGLARQASLLHLLLVPRAAGDRQAAHLLAAPWDYLLPDPRFGVWTDDYSDLWRIIAW